jgi:N-acetylmuramoyl-L-alanine amidase
VLARGISSRASHPRVQQQDQQNPPQQPAPQQAAPQQGAPPQAPSPQGAPPAPAAPQQSPQEQAPAPPVHVGPVVVVDPGHGGTDTGARGASGLVEKDVVLQIAKILRAELERIGYRVVMTRNDDSNPSYEDRAALANAYRDPIFVSLHVSTTGATGNTRAYFYQFLVPFQATDASLTSNAAIPWEQAQRPFGEQSRRLANLVQIELTRRFSQSPNAPTPAAVRNLRSVAAPAVAVEISSVSVSDPITLTSLSGLLAASIAKGIATFRPMPAPVTGQP